MKLIDLLLLELPKQGGWPGGYDCISTNGYNQVWAYKTKGGVMGKDLHICSSEEGNVTREQYEAALAASKTEWDGAGLPPVGCEFEYQSSSGWVTASMKFCGRSFAIVEAGGLETWLSLSANIRPIRSEADKKRDEFVDQVMQWMHHAGRAEVELIYDYIKSKKILID